MGASNDEEGVYNVHSHVCHRLSCHTLRGANGRYYARVKFWASALELGLKPCENCKPFFLPTAEPLPVIDTGQAAAPKSVDEQIATNELRIAELGKLIAEQKEPAAPVPVSPLPAAEVLAWRRRIAQAITRLDQTGDRPPNEGLAAHISRLSRAGVIPRSIAAMMKTILELRNAPEYDSKTPSNTECRVAWDNWLAIQEWASKEGLQI
jgi:hypothetical protein